MSRGTQTAHYHGLPQGWVSRRVVLADVPSERKPERGYIRRVRSHVPPGMFPRNENRNEDIFAKTTLLRNPPSDTNCALLNQLVSFWRSGEKGAERPPLKTAGEQPKRCRLFSLLSWRSSSVNFFLIVAQRALRSKKFNPDRKFQSRLEIFNPGSKFSISIENFNPRVSIYGALVVYREGLDRKFQSTIDRSKFSIPKAAIDFFQSPGPLGGREIWRGFCQEFCGILPDPQNKGSKKIGENFRAFFVRKIRASIFRVSFVLQTCHPNRSSSGQTAQKTAPKKKQPEKLRVAHRKRAEYCFESTASEARPKGPFGTKNALAQKIVVFCYRRSIYYNLDSLPLVARKLASEFLSRSELLSR